MKRLLLVVLILLVSDGYGMGWFKRARGGGVGETKAEVAPILLDESKTAPILSRDSFSNFTVSQSVPAYGTIWSSDGSKLLARFSEHNVDKIQVYRVAADKLIALGVAVPGRAAGWSSDGSKLWVQSKQDEIQVYQVSDEELVAIGTTVPGYEAGLDSNGSKLWVKFLDHGVDRIQLYKVMADRLVAEEGLSTITNVMAAGWSPDGSKIWVRFTNVDDVLEVVVGRFNAYGLVRMNVDSILGVTDIGWGPDESKLWMKFNHNGFDIIRLYLVDDFGLKVAKGSPFYGSSMGWNSNGSRLWVMDNSDIINKIQIYQFASKDQLMRFGEQFISGDDAGWSLDGSKLWVRFRNSDYKYMIQAYQIATGKLVKVGEPVFGSAAGWGSGGSKLWVLDSRTKKLRFYKIVNDRLEAVPLPIMSDRNASWSPDGSKLLVYGELLATVYFGD